MGDPREAAEKLKKDLEENAAVQAEWSQDPAAVFVKYGLAERKEDVKILSKGEGDVTGQGIKGVKVCVGLEVTLEACLPVLGVVGVTFDTGEK